MDKKRGKAIEIRDLSKHFDKQKSDHSFALRNVNLHLNKGEISCLTGPSGSGKTTLLQLVGLLDTPSSGEVIIDGVPTAKQKDSTKTQIRRSKIGFIYQFHNLLPEFSALENVAMPLLIQGKSKDESFDAAKKALSQVNLSNRADFKSSQLSGGQQQRVAICRAFVHKPALILADEPTGNLDSKNSERVFDLLLSITKENSTSCLIVTHNLELARKVPKQIFIQDGQVT